MDIKKYQSLSLDEKLQVCRCLEGARANARRDVHPLDSSPNYKLIEDSLSPHPGNLIFIDDSKVEFAVSLFGSYPVRRKINHIH